jgi:hypothetical protein
MTAVCSKIVFGVALFLAAVSDSSGQSQRPPQTPNVQTDQQSISPGKSEPRSKEEIESTTDATSEFWPFPIIGHRLKITDSLLAFFTFGLVIIAVWQGYQLRRTVLSAEKATEVTERAYVTGGPGNRRQHEESSGKMYQTHIVFTGMNTGKTPAFTQKIYWGVCKETEWPEIGGNWPIVESSKSEIWEDILPPQMHRDDRVPAMCSATYVDGDGPHVCWGRILYRDIFGNDHETAWKHRVIRTDGIITSEALAGAYSSEWKNTKK